MYLHNFIPRKRYLVESESSPPDVKVGCICIYVLEGEDDTLLSSRSTPPPLATELRYVYRSRQLDERLYYLTRSKNKVLVVDTKCVEFFPDGVEPPELRGQIKDYAFEELELSMVFPPVDEEPKKIGYIFVYIRRYEKDVVDENLATISNVSIEKEKRDVFSYLTKFEGEPYYLSYTGNPILVIDKNRIVYGSEDEEDSEVVNEEEEEEVEEEKSTNEEAAEEAVGTIRLQVPVGGPAGTTLKTERREVFLVPRRGLCSHQQNLEVDQLKANERIGVDMELYFISRSGIKIFIRDPSRVHFYADGDEELTSEEDLMEVIRKEKEEETRDKMEEAVPSCVKQRKLKKKIKSKKKELPSEPVPDTMADDLQMDITSNSRHADDPVVGTVDMHVTVPPDAIEEVNDLEEQHHSTVTNSRSADADEQQIKDDDFEGYADDGPFDEEDGESETLSDILSEDTSGASASRVSSNERTSVEETKLSRKLPKRRCNVYASREYGGRPYYLTKSGNRVFVVDHKKIHPLPPPVVPAKQNEADTLEYTEADHTHDDDAAEEQKLVGTIKMYSRVDNGSQKMGVSYREVYKSNKFTEPYYLSKTGNKIFVLDPKKIIYLPLSSSDGESAQEEEQEIFETVVQLLGPDDGDDPKIGTINIRIPRGGSGLGADKETRDVYCSLALDQRPYYYTRTGNKIFIIEPHRINFSCPLPLVKTVRRKVESAVVEICAEA